MLLPKVLESKELVKNFMTLKKELLAFEKGHTHTYYSMHLPQDAVLILATNAQDEVLTLREYRHPTAQILWGLPGGLIDPGESLEACAKRELLEETGCQAEKWLYLGCSYPYPGVSSQKTHFFRAYQAKKIQQPHLDPSESLTSLFISKKELRDKIQQEPVDGLLLSALHLNSLIE